MAKKGKGLAIGKKVKIVEKPITGDDDDNSIDQSTSGAANRINGGDGNDNIVGTGFADRVNAGDGDDTVMGGAGDDVLFGNDGKDTAAYAGSIFNFIWEEGKGNSLTVTDTTGAEGVDTLKHFECLKFDDYTFDLNGPNAALILADDQSTDEDTATSFSIQAWDFDGGTPFIESVAVTGPGTVSASADVALTQGMGTGASFQISFDPSGLYDTLAVGQSATETVTVVVNDGQGNISTKDFTITIDGVNDDPTLGAGAMGTIEDGAQVSLNLSALGDDIDSDDDGSTPTYSVTGAPSEGHASISGTDLRFDPVGDFQDLAVGETRDVTVEITATDRHGATAVNTVTVTVEGTNDAPIISVGESVLSGGVTEVADLAAGENAVTHTAAGQVSFSDVDVSDTHTSSYVENGADYRGSFSIQAPTTTSTTTEGEIGWQFDIADADIDDLREGQVLTQSYDITVDDGNGGSDTTTVTVTITGTNDAPIIGSAAISEHFVESVAPAALSTSGVIAFSDVDTLDTHTVTRGPLNVNLEYQGQQLPNDPEGLRDDDIAALESALVVNADGTWSFDVPAGDRIERLAEGMTVTLTSTITVTDDSGAANNTDTQLLTISITGTNDAPEIISSVTSGGVTEITDLAAGENVDTLSASGTIEFRDIDQANTHIVNVTEMGGGYRGGMAAQVTTDTEGYGNANNGVVDWQFDIADAEIDDLAAGEVLTQSYEIEIVDNDGGSTTETVTLTITGTNDAPVIEGTSETAGAVREAGNFDDGAIDGGTPSVSGTMVSSDVDNGATATWSGNAAGTYGSFAIDASTGEWTYTLNNSASNVQALVEGQVETETFTVTVTDDQGATDTETVTVTVTGTNDAPVIGVSDTSGAVRESGHFDDGSIDAGTPSATGTMTSSDVDAGATATWSGGGNGNYGSLSIDPSTGVWTYTLNNNAAATQALNEGQVATENFTVRVTDDRGAYDTQTVSIQVTGTNDQPVANDVTLVAAVTGNSTFGNGWAGWTQDAGPNGGLDGIYIVSSYRYNFSLDTSGNLIPGDNAVADISFSGWLNQYRDGPNLGTAFGPRLISEDFAGQAGDLVRFEYRAYSGSDAASITATLINVDTGAQTPVFFEQTPYRQTSPVRQVEVPIAQGGNYRIEFKVGSFDQTDGGAVGARLVIGTAGIVRSGVTEGDAVTFEAVQFLSEASDVDSTAVLSMHAVDATSALGAAVSIDVNGDVVYDASAVQQLAAGESVVDTFQFTVTDENGATSTATASITLNGVNDAPTITTGAMTAVEDGAVAAFDLSTIADDPDSDDDGASLTYTVTGQPGEGSASINGTSLEFDPGADFQDLDDGETRDVTVSVTATDQHGESATNTITVTVTGVNDAPVATAIAVSVDEDTNINGVVAGSDLDGDALTFAVASGPANGSVSMNADGTFTYTPDADYNGNDSFTYVANDGDVDSAPQTVSITVNPVNDAPVANDVSGEVDEDQSTVQRAASIGATLAPNLGRFFVFDFDTGTSSTVLRTTSSGSFNTFDQVAAHYLDGGNGIVATINPNNSGWGFASTLYDNGVGTIVDGSQYSVTDTDGVTGFAVSATAVEFPDGNKDVDQIALNLTGLILSDGRSVDLTMNVDGIDYEVNSTDDIAASSVDFSANVTTPSDADMVTVSADFSDIDVGDTHTFSVNTAGTIGQVTNNNDGTFTYDANGQFDHLAVGETVTDTFTYTVDDGNGGLDTATATITITGTNDAPVAVWGGLAKSEGGPQQTVPVGDLVSDVDAGDSHTVTSVQILSGGGLVTLLAGGAGFAFQNNGDFDSLSEGEIAFVDVEYTVEDAAGASVTDFGIIEVTGTNDAPVAVWSGLTTTENAPDHFVAVSELITDVDLNDSHVLTDVQIFGAGNVTVAGDGSGFTWQNAGQFEYLAAGESELVDVQYTVQDSAGATVTGFAQIQVNGENDLPTWTGTDHMSPDDFFNATNVTLNVLPVDPVNPDLTAQLSASGTLIFGDFDLSDTHTATLEQVDPTQISNGTATVTVESTTGLGEVEWTVNPFNSNFTELAAGEILTEQFYLHIEDSAGIRDTQLINVSFVGANDTPVAANDTTSTDEDTAITIDVLANDSDVDGDSLTVTSVSGLSTLGATVTVGANGDVTYNPTSSLVLAALNSGENLTDEFEYEVSDGHGGTATATATVTVDGISDEVDLNLAFSGTLSGRRYVSIYNDLADVDADSNPERLQERETTGGAIGGAGMQQGDFDGDGDIDLVVMGSRSVSGSTYYWWLNRYPYSSVNLLTNMGDLDGDGRDEYYSSYWTVQAYNDIRDVAVGDFNDDGLLDFSVAYSYHSRFFLNKGTSDGSSLLNRTDFTEVTEYHGRYTTSSWGADAGNLDSDDEDEFIFTLYNGSRVVIDNQGEAGSQQLYHLRPAGVEVGDLNGDGLMDFVVAGWNSYDRVYFNRGDTDGDGRNSFQYRQIDSGGNNMEANLVDLDGDGDLDILMSDYSRGAEVHINNGDETFTRLAMPFNGTAYSYGIAAVDVDGDGDLDIVAGRYQSVSWTTDPFDLFINQGDTNGDGLIEFTGDNLVGEPLSYDILVLDDTPLV